MFGSIFAQILTSIVVLKTTYQHFIPQTHECFSSYWCNHTWVQECGREATGTDKRVFSDECTRHEFNCDNNKDYTLVDIKECFPPPLDTTPAADLTPHPMNVNCTRVPSRNDTIQSSNTTLQSTSTTDLSTSTTLSSTITTLISTTTTLPSSSTTLPSSSTTVPTTTTTAPAKF